MCVEQGLDRGPCGVGMLRGAHDGLHDGAVEHDDQLIGQPLGVGGLAALGLVGEVLAEPELVVAGDPPGRVTGVGQFGGCVDKRAAAERLRRRPPAQPVEDRQDLLAGRAAWILGRDVQAEDGAAVRVEALGDEPVLAAELLLADRAKQRALSAS